MRLAMYQPDIPQNAGAMIRLAACLATPLDLIAPFGFAADDRRLRRVAMDYGADAPPAVHASWDAFLAAPRRGRLALLTTRAGACARSG